MRLLPFTLAMSFALGACAHSSMVLLPDEDGGQGEVTVRPLKGEGKEVVVNQANSRVNLDSANPTVRPLGPKGLNPEEALLLSELPPPAKSFTLYFLEGTTDLTADSVPVLDQIRAEIAGRPGAEIQVTGHTDTVGGGDDNDALSRKRAAEIVDLLAARGFDRSVMSAVGRGERELKEATADNVSNARNRRVEVTVR